MSKKMNDLTLINDENQPLSWFPLLILINMFILFHELLELLKSPNPLWLQSPGIQQLPLLFHPIQHQVFFHPMLGRIPVINLYKSHHLQEFQIPFLILRHNFFN